MLSFYIIQTFCAVSLSILYKSADVLGCRKTAVNFFVYLAAIPTSFIYFPFAGFDVSTVGLGLLSGLLISIASLTLLMALAHGNLNISFILVNLSILLPLLNGFFFWNEQLTVRKILGLICIISSIIFLNFAHIKKDTSKGELDG